MCIDLTEYLYKTPGDRFLKLYDNSNRSFVTYSRRLPSKANNRRMYAKRKV